MANLKLEAERLSIISSRLLEAAKRVTEIAGDVPSTSQIVPDIVGIAHNISESAAGLVGIAGPEINPKLEAERLSGISSRSLEVAKRVAEIAGNVPSGSQVVHDLVSIAEDISSSATSLVGM